MLTSDILLSLEDVRPAGQNQWSSKCPNRDHRHGRLYIKDAGDRTLFNCFAGCESSAVIESLELSYSDLFHEDIIPEVNHQKWHNLSYQRLQHERIIVQLAYNQKNLNSEDKARAREAYIKLKRAGWLNKQLSSTIITRARRRNYHG